MRRVKVVKFLGGLGNQMFQFAFYAALSEKFGERVKADISGFKNYGLHNGYELQRIFPVNLKYSSGWENFVLGGGSDIVSLKLRLRLGITVSSYYEQKGASYYDAAIFEDYSSTYYWGFWQNEKYFSEISDKIKASFSFESVLKERNAEMEQMIKGSNAISIHVRRGDYVNHSLHGGVCDLDYYRKAIMHIETICKDPTYFVFSDDIDWCRENLQIKRDCYFIDWNKGTESYIDMQLMSLCKHNIIANSSFSWWGAWLNSNRGNVVVAPGKWFAEQEVDRHASDLIPARWTRV